MSVRILFARMFHVVFLFVLINIGMYMRSRVATYDEDYPIFVKWVNIVLLVVSTLYLFGIIGPQL